MRNFKILLKKNFLEFKRTKKWYVYIISFSLIALISALTAKYLLGALSPFLEMMGVIYTPTVADSYAQFIANMIEVGYLLIGIMFATTLLKEKNSSTYYTLKSNGVKETQIVLAHYVSKLILITVSYLISLIVLIGCNLLMFKQYTGYRGVLSISYIYLMFIFTITFSLFISSIVKKTSHSIVAIIISYFGFYILASVPTIKIFTPLYGMNLANDIMYGNEVVLADQIINISCVIGISIALLLATIFFFKNKINNRKELVENNG